MQISKTIFTHYSIEELHNMIIISNSISYLKHLSIVLSLVEMQD